MNQVYIDPRIPMTLVEATSLAQVRFHSWNEDARRLVHKIIYSGRVVCITCHADPIAIKAKNLADELDDTHITRAIAKIAVALGGKVTDYDRE
jgi:hypothetical protein